MSGLLGLLGLLGPDGRGLGLAFLQRLLGLGLRVVLELELGPLEFRLAQRGGLARRRLGRGLGLRFPRRLSISLCSFVRSGRGVGFRGRAVRRGLLRGDAVRSAAAAASAAACCCAAASAAARSAAAASAALAAWSRSACSAARRADSSGSAGRLGLRRGLRRGGCRGGGLRSASRRARAAAAAPPSTRRRRRPVPGPLGRGAGGVEVGPHGLKGCQE